MYLTIRKKAGAIALAFLYSYRRPTNFSCIYSSLYHRFILIELTSSRLYLDKGYRADLPFAQPIKSDIIYSFSQEYEIFVAIGEIGQQWRYFLAYIAQSHRTRLRYSIFTMPLCLLPEHHFCYQIAYNHSR